MSDFPVRDDDTGFRTDAWPRLGGWRMWRKQRDCFHHDRLTEESWIRSRLIDAGSRKWFWCRECGRTWFT